MTTIPEINQEFSTGALVTLFTLDLGTTGIDFSVQPVINNGNFLVGTGWTYGAYWSRTSGLATHASSGTVGLLTQTLNAGLMTDLSYTVTYTVSGYSGAGTIRARLNGYTAGASTARSANGTYSDTVTSKEAGATLFEFVPTADFVGSITGVSISKLTANENSHIFYFTNHTDGNGSVVLFNGQVYTPIPIEATGFAWSSEGQFAQPTLTISNANRTLNSVLTQYEDLLGAEVTRTRTYERYLDTGAEPDPTQVFPIDVYRISRKSNHNAAFVEFELASVLDQEGVMLPKRQMYRDICTHVYRRYDPNLGTFRYSNRTTCPYANEEGKYFTEKGVATTNKAQDVCGKKLSDCKARFHDTVANAEQPALPYRGFPGLTQIR